LKANHQKLSVCARLYDECGKFLPCGKSIIMKTIKEHEKDSVNYSILSFNDKADGIVIDIKKLLKACPDIEELEVGF